MNRLAGSFLLSVLLCFSMAGCAAENTAEQTGTDDVSEVRNTVDVYLSSLEDGDLQKSADYLADNSKVHQLMEEYEQLTSPILEIFGSIEMTDELKDQYEHFADQIVTLSFRSHEIGDVTKISDTEYQVQADITSVDYDDVSHAVRSFLSSGRDQILTEEKKKELKKIYDEQGQTALDNAILSEMFDYMTVHFDEIAKDCSTVKITAVFTVTKENDVWKISDAGSGQ